MFKLMCSCVFVCVRVHTSSARMCMLPYGQAWSVHVWHFPTSLSILVLLMDTSSASIEVWVSGREAQESDLEVK